MSRINPDPSVDAEGFDLPGRATPDRLEDEPAFGAASIAPGDRETAEHNVWDEPASRAAGIVAPAGAATYAQWYRSRLADAPVSTSWLVTILLGLIGGPFAVAGVFLQAQAGNSLVAVAMVGPVLEEMMKLGAVLIVLENRPYLFRSPAQILVAVLASALAFAAIENLLYIHVYVADPTPGFQMWRWIVCTGVHACATSIGGLGLVRIWHRAQPRNGQDYSKPLVHHAYPFIVGGVVFHGVYNFLAVVFAVSSSVF
ncbi:MAG: PrsW family intramembrane metalloprotease [Candidatus Hydrogenedentes bacterium]|nr:PrsW family intramembrane metalloprotease [Candidatus Hydrogenedentota bacterium]